MIKNNHNDSLFQICVLDPLYKIVDHVAQIPGDFKEQFIKYDDNSQDDTTILFDMAALYQMMILLEVSKDFITDYFYEGFSSYYLKSNVFQRLIDKADTEEKKKKISQLYSHLNSNRT